MKFFINQHTKFYGIKLQSTYQFEEKDFFVIIFRLACFSFKSNYYNYRIFFNIINQLS